MKSHIWSLGTCDELNLEVGAFEVPNALAGTWRVTVGKSRGMEKSLLPWSQGEGWIFYSSSLIFFSLLSMSLLWNSYHSEYFQGRGDCRRFIRKEKENGAALGPPGFSCLCPGWPLRLHPFSPVEELVNWHRPLLLEAALAGGSVGAAVGRTVAS